MAGAAAPPYAELVAAWKALRSRTGLSVREVACVGVARTLLVAEIGEAGLPRIALSAGVHGDEPAAPWALLSIVRDGLLDARYAYRIWACTNPSGYQAFTRASAEGVDVNRSFSRGGRTPESRAIITSNRDRTFELSIDLHEDFEADGFYLYENLRDREARFAPSILETIVQAGFGLQEFRAGFDDAYAQAADDARLCTRGCILTFYPESLAHFADGLPYSLYLLRSRTAAHALTFETPRARLWDERVAMHRVATVSAIARLTRLRERDLVDERHDVRALG
jgi:predicted deacylase